MKTSPPQKKKKKEEHNFKKSDQIATDNKEYRATVSSGLVVTLLGFCLSVFYQGQQ